jgi:hypothetical protein
VAEARRKARLVEEDRLIVTASDFALSSLVEFRRHGARWRRSEHTTPQRAVEAAIKLVATAQSG